MKHKIAYIEWEDSSSAKDSGWQSAEGWKNYDPVICTSIGRILFEDANSIVLAPHWYEDTILGAMRIPKSAIRKRRAIKV